MKTKRLLKLKHDHLELGFLSAHVTREDGDAAAWSLLVESPGETDVFRDHLAAATSMEFTMMTRDGESLRGEAYVSSLSGGTDSATMVVLAGVGTLRPA